MKYTKPTYIFEALDTEDIMAVSRMTEDVEYEQTDSTTNAGIAADSILEQLGIKK